jgi:hypothetical protein
MQAMMTQERIYLSGLSPKERKSTRRKLNLLSRPRSRRQSELPILIIHTQRHLSRRRMKVGVNGMNHHTAANANAARMLQNPMIPIRKSSAGSKRLTKQLEEMTSLYGLPTM